LRFWRRRKNDTYLIPGCIGSNVTDSPLILRVNPSFPSGMVPHREDLPDNPRLPADSHGGFRSLGQVLTMLRSGTVIWIFVGV
jgi:hypothetical protein